MSNYQKSQSTEAENSAETTKETFFNIVNNPNYTKKGNCSSWYYFDFNGVQIEAYDAWDDFTTVFSFTIGGEKKYVYMPFKAKGTKIRERVITKAYNEIKRKIKSIQSTEAKNSVATNAQKNNKGMYTYGNESDCTFFKTKKEAKEHRKENFGSMYASEAEMDRLIPIRKVA